MTMRTLDIALKRIANRQHNAHALRASLHGMKIPLKTSYTKQETEWTKDQEDKIEKAREAALQRILAKKKKYGGHKLNHQNQC